MNTYQESLLSIIGYQLFGGERSKLISKSKLDVLNDAEAQTVFSLTFAYLKNELAVVGSKDFEGLNEEFFRNVILNTNNFQKHNELHDLMKSHGIPYVQLKD